MASDKLLAKTCITCGLSKPLAAFLQITGPEGTSYGSICGTCRGSGMGKKIVIPDKEDDHNSSSSSGLKLDAKAKIELEAAKREEAAARKEVDKKERQKLEENVADTEQNKAQKQADDRRHREEFLEPKKREGFLNYQATKSPTEFAKTIEQQQIQIEKSQKDDVVKTEEQSKSLNLGDSHLDLSQTGLIKYQSSEMIKAKTLLGPGAIMNTIEQQHQAATAADGKAQTPTPPVAENKTEAPGAPKNVTTAAPLQTATNSTFQKMANWLETGSSYLNPSFLSKSLGGNTAAPPAPKAPEPPENKVDPILGFINTTFQPAKTDVTPQPSPPTPSTPSSTRRR